MSLTRLPSKMLQKINNWLCQPYVAYTTGWHNLYGWTRGYTFADCCKLWHYGTGVVDCQWLAQCKLCLGGTAITDFWCWQCCRGSSGGSRSRACGELWRSEMDRSQPEHANTDCLGRRCRGAQFDHQQRCFGNPNCDRALSGL